MQKSKIEWTDYSTNPVRGLCPMDCKDTQGESYCYARSLYRRFHWNPEIRFDSKAIIDILSLQKPSRIFIGSTIELFGDWVNDFWMERIFRVVKAKPQHTFIFLTKAPWNLPKWNPWPDNVWVGASVTNREQFEKAICYLPQVAAKIKFISFEPLLELIYMNKPYGLEGIDWVILGGKSGKGKFCPPEAWIAEIEAEAERLGVKVFEKNNLREPLERWPHATYWEKLPRRELPNER